MTLSVRFETARPPVGALAQQAGDKMWPFTRKSDGEMDADAIIAKLQKALESQPPTIGVIGVSGTGKSSTINAMFNTQLHVSNSVRGTLAFQSSDVDLQIKRGKLEGTTAQLRVVDAPGLGEDIRKDPKYLEMYRTHLPACDVILWVSNARNRAVALEQQYLAELRPFHDRMIFGINQVDLIEPMNWDNARNMPSREQEKSIGEILSDRKERFEYVIGKSIKMVPYSAKQYHDLTYLHANIIDTCGDGRKWLFEALRSFSPKDWLDRATGITAEDRAAILKEFGEH